MQLCPDHVIQHDDIRTRSDRLICFLEILTLHVDEQGEAGYSSNRFDCIRDRP